MKLLGKTCKKSVSILLSAVMVFGLFTIIPFTASAAENGELTENSSRLSAGEYTAKSDLTVNNRLVCEGDVQLTLTEGVTLNIPKGINVTGESSLTIGGSGKLVISGNTGNAAGIGGDEGQSLSLLTVNGGTIDVTGGACGAGIGGGKNGYGGIVTINGGTVTAHGGEGGGAGIGTGAMYEDTGETADSDGIYIKGGTVTATGSEKASGIGEGAILDVLMEDCMAAKIEISGGTVNAYANNNVYDSDLPESNKASVGGGGTTIKITGGNVYAGTAGIYSNNPVELSWTNVLDSFYFYGIYADVNLLKNLVCEETGEQFSQGTYPAPAGAGSHALEHKTLVTAYHSLGEDVPYLDVNDVEATASGVIDLSTALNDSKELSLTWYAVKNNITCSERITCSGNINLILCDGCELTANSGISVNEGSSLTIFCQSGKSGKLNSRSDISEYAAIGGDSKNSGTITIVGGDIQATTEDYAAGIGGGYKGSGTVIIYGGTVNAEGGLYSAGIGGGGYSSDMVTINGGTVTATGGRYGAGIGSGQYSTAAANVTINGGTITAASSEYGAGIGGGFESDGNVTVTGGTITATGGKNSAGIGGGNSGGCTVKIEGGNILSAQGGSDAAGIGAGYNSRTDSTITINGGTVNAQGGSAALSYNTGGAGIGTGYASNANSAITINGGQITASGGLNAAGIGTGNFASHDSSTITINGGQITASGGSDAAGIGSGNDADKATAISLSWNNFDSDSIYSNCYLGDITLQKAFRNKDNASDKFYAGAVEAENLNSKTLIPYNTSTYTVTWKNYNGEILETDEALEGTIPEYNGETPTNDSGEYYDFIFSGWSPEITRVTEDIVYTAVYSAKPKIIIDSSITNGTVTSDKASANPGETVTLNIAPDEHCHLKNITVETYGTQQAASIELSGSGSTRTFTMPNACVIVKASFELDNVTVTWKNYDGTVLEINGNVPFGTTPVYSGGTPKKAGDAQYKYLFSGWSPEVGAVTGDTTYTAQFEQATYVERVEPYIDENGAYILGAVEHYVINGRNYPVTADDSMGEELSSLDLSYFDFNMLLNGTYQINYYTGPTESLTELVIPKTFNGKKITVLGNDVNSGFVNCRVVPQGTPTFTLVLNENITKITPYSFYAVQVAKVTGNTSGLSEIGSYAFSWANSRHDYNIDIDLDYEGAINNGNSIFNNMKVTANLKHATKFRYEYLGSTSFSCIFTDNHIYGEPTWTWADDFSSATAAFTCADARCKHQEIVDAAVTSEPADDSVTYTAAAEMYGKTYTDARTIPDVTLIGYSLSLEGDIGLNFYMDLSDRVIQSDPAYMRFIIPKNGEPATQEINVNNARKVTSDGKTYYVFKCQVAAKEMTAKVKAQIFYGDKESMEYAFSVKDYADYLLAHADDDQKYKEAAPAVKAMLNYGAYSQIHFDKRTDELANKDLPEEERKLGDVTINVDAPVFDALPEGTSFPGASLSLKSETTLSLYFISDETLTFSCDNYTVETDKTGQYQIARIRGIKASHIGDTIELNVNGATVSYSPLNYCKNVLDDPSQDENLQNTVKALYWYWQAALEYFK